MNAEMAKVIAARDACSQLSQLLRGAKYVGLGTGSTTRLFIEACRDLLKDKLLIVSSMDTGIYLKELGMAYILDISAVDRVDIYVDGADEVDSNLNMVKGRGGAFFREKLLAMMAEYRAYVVDFTKLNNEPYLFRKPIPIEVCPAALSYAVKVINSLGYGKAFPRSSSGKDGPVISDNGNVIVDLVPSIKISDPEGADAALRRVHGVIATGLFPNELVDVVVVGYPEKALSLRKNKRTSR